MKDELIGFEVARLAKEKGFNVPTLYCFLLDGSEQFSSGDEGDYALYNHNLWDYYSRPTQTLLARWLREVHKIHVHPVLQCEFYHYADDEDFIEYGYLLNDLRNPNPSNDVTPYNNGIDCFYVNQEGKYWTYEESLEEGLKEGLKLIK